jgi:hypothetical protein
VHQGDASVYVENVRLISLRQKYNYKEHEGKTIETDGSKLLLDELKLISIGRRDRIPNYRGALDLDLTNVKYSTYKQCREENLKVMERIMTKYEINMTVKI